VTQALKSVDQLAAEYKEAGWDCLPDIVDQMFEDCLVPAVDIKQAAADVFTSVPCGYYYAPADNLAAVHAPEGATRQDVALCKAAIDRAGYVDFPGTLDNEQLIGGAWVKVAYSPTVNRAATYLNFLPGKYPGGIPNLPGPISSMLTTGLLGAGLGYGAGWLGEKLMPGRWERGKLRKTLAALGGLAGAVPGAAWAGFNVAAGKPWYSSELLQALPRHPTTGKPIEVPLHSFDPDQRARYEQQAFEQAGKQGSYYGRLADELPGELGKQYKAAIEKVARDWGAEARALTGEEAFLVKHAFGPDTFGPNLYQPKRPKGPLDVDVDALGNVLWEVGAKPQEAAMTMGALHAAQQMPGGTSEPGWVTPKQMAHLAANMGAGYVSGALVGSALGLLTGMPRSTQQTLKNTGMYMGIVNSVVPRLFGQ